ncbi:type I DNA topoisomerase [Patescibacteria group bacterium]|nr:type I DNA topoisomerase [Patescibacteria group bacterium]MBU0777175.1 type I DNA topoisomerase [Patescibacteria group bacterium]MBU0922897.1 type I DNA topoisomerase [Patescibacteria group bacterium]MBU1844519.1 type I DNA topoisomerase [Patescibacteria group bacterium]
MDLIIVESPTKARTITKFLSGDVNVVATTGHLKDLPKSKLGVDIENNFKPDYVVVPGREKDIEEMVKSAKKAEKIYLATDPDREGEAIAYHAYEIFHENAKGKISEDKIKRIVFHEITKKAVNKAIESPRSIDKKLIDAQIARRVLDRLVGYELSPLLWKKVRRGLSAGRVQTITVRLIVEREREIKKFKPDEYWEIFCEVAQTKGKKIKLTVNLARIDDEKADITNKKDADEVVTGLNKAKYKVLAINKREVKKNPNAPFTTSTMTQAAANLFHWSAKKTMSVAQRLYEEGLITYHRTDSTNIAISAINKARGFIEKKYGENYLPEQPRLYKTKAKVAQEAHEAIRPTKMKEEVSVPGRYGNDAEKLYGLIWNRFIACQMKEAIYDETTIEVEGVDGKKYLLRTSGRMTKFDGWRKVIKKTGNNEEQELPALTVDEQLKLIKVIPNQKFTEPPARYNEASIIRTLEKLGIGRPSTYAPTISTIQVRNYVEKKERKFYSTPVGVAVNDFLLANFPDVFEYSFTAQMEADLDDVAEGKKEWEKLISGFWNPLGKKLKKVEKEAKRVKIETEKLGKKCTKCKKGELVIRIGRFGKFISCSRFPDCDFTDKYIEKVGMKCPDCGKGDVIIRQTKKKRRFFGCSQYPDCKWASWRKPTPEKPPTSS